MQLQKPDTITFVGSGERSLAPPLFTQSSGSLTEEERAAEQEKVAARSGIDEAARPSVITEMFLQVVQDEPLLLPRAADSWRG